MTFRDLVQTNRFSILLYILILGSLVFLRKSEGKRQLGRPRRRLEDNITMDLGETGWGGMD
jgi:hypothetical protein